MAREMTDVGGPLAVEVVTELAGGDRETVKRVDRKRGRKTTHSVRELKLMARRQIRGEMFAKMTMSVRQRSHWQTNRG